MKKAVAVLFYLITVMLWAYAFQCMSYEKYLERYWHFKLLKV